MVQINSVFPCKNLFEMAFLRIFTKNNLISQKLKSANCVCSKLSLSLLNENPTKLASARQLTTSSIFANKNEMPKLGGAAGKDILDVSFNDPRAAFKSKTTFELLRAYLVYVLCSSEYLVNNNMKVCEKNYRQLIIPHIY